MLEDQKNYDAYKLAVDQALSKYKISFDQTNLTRESKEALGADADYLVQDVATLEKLINEQKELLKSQEEFKDLDEKKLDEIVEAYAKEHYNVKFDENGNILENKDTEPIAPGSGMILSASMATAATLLATMF